MMIGDEHFCRYGYDRRTFGLRGEKTGRQPQRQAIPPSTKKAGMAGAGSCKYLQPVAGPARIGTTEAGTGCK
jgi:hypothetical protein